jgi:hypothetical protein
LEVVVVGVGVGGTEVRKTIGGGRVVGMMAHRRAVYQTTGVHFIVFSIISVDATKKRRTDMHGG